MILNAWEVGPGSLLPATDRALTWLVEKARNGRGCVICFAAGNGGYQEIENTNRYAADRRVITVGASIGPNPTNPCSSTFADQFGQTTNLPAKVDTRAYYSVYGRQMSLVAPSSTSEVDSRNLDPVLAGTRVGSGDWIASAEVRSHLASPATAQSGTLELLDASGFQDFRRALVGMPGGHPRELVHINSVSGNILTVDQLTFSYPAGTVVSAGALDYDRLFGGTSYAVSLVAGAAALVLSAAPWLTWDQVRKILRATAVKIDRHQQHPDGKYVNGFSNWYGYGRLDVEAAVERALKLPSPNTLATRFQTGKAQARSESKQER